MIRWKNFCLTIYREIKKHSVKKTEWSMNAKLLNLKRKGKFEDSEYYRIRSTDRVGNSDVDFAIYRRVVSF